MINKVKKMIFSKQKTIIMGILNVTPDSFSDGGQFDSIDKAFNHAKLLLQNGADIIDVGGQSTRPGHIEVDLKTELSRVIPIIKKIKKELNCPISIDTYRAQVAREALKAGACIVNDVWGLQKDNGEMAKTIKEFDALVVIMHNNSTNIYSSDIIKSMKQFFQKSINIAKLNKIDVENIIIDPGIGFAKNYEQNLKVLNNLEKFKDIAPILLGVSKKRFIGEELSLLPDERISGTIAVNTLGVMKGVKIIRVHNVLEHKQAFSIIDKLIYY